MYREEIGLVMWPKCDQNVTIILSWTINTTRRIYVSISIRERIFTLTLISLQLNFDESLETTISFLCNCWWDETISNIIQWPQLHEELETRKCPWLPGPYTFGDMSLTWMDDRYTLCAIIPSRSLTYVGFIQLHFSIRYLYLNVTLLGINPNTCTARHMFNKKELHLQMLLTTMNSIVSTIKRIYVFI